MILSYLKCNDYVNTTLLTKYDSIIIEQKQFQRQLLVPKSRCPNNIIGLFVAFRSFQMIRQHQLM